LEIDDSFLLYHYKNIEFTFSKNIVFACFSERDDLKCIFINNLDKKFQLISYNFVNQYSEIKTYYFKEKNQFILLCSKSSVYYLYLFNENDMNNNIKEKTFTLENNNGMLSLIYNSKTDDYDIIYNGNFTETCEAFNKEEQFPIITTNQMQEIIKTTNVNINIYSTTKAVESTNIYNPIITTNQMQEIINTTNVNINIYSTTKAVESTNNNNHLSSTFLETNISSSILNSYSFSYSNYSKYLYESFLNFKDNIIEGNINISAVEEGKGYFFEEKGLLMSFMTTESQKENKNGTRINLEQCEDKLKEFYNVSKNNSLFILKMEIEQKFLNIPKIEYDVYYPLNNTKMEALNLSLCENTKIEISIPVNISKADIDKYNPKSNYYNDICSRAKSDNGTDVTQKDRREEFFNKKNVFVRR